MADLEQMPKVLHAEMFALALKVQDKWKELEEPTKAQYLEDVFEVIALAQRELLTKEGWRKVGKEISIEEMPKGYLAKLGYVELPSEEEMNDATHDRFRGRYGSRREILVTAINLKDVVRFIHRWLRQGGDARAVAAIRRPNNS